MEHKYGVYFPLGAEAPEFRNDVLQALRQPLESGTVTVARARASVTYPARFQLVLAANPCPCGHGHGKAVHCRCSPLQRRAYAARLSGPLLDRVDVQVHVPAVTTAGGSGLPGESSAVVAQRVARARAAAQARWHEVAASTGAGAVRAGSLSGAAPAGATAVLSGERGSGRAAQHGDGGRGWSCNGAVPGVVLRTAPCRLPAAVTADLDHALERGLLSLRGYDRTLRVAWTRADLAGRDRPDRDDVGMALLFRGAAAGVAA